MNPICSICFELFTVNDKLKTTQCGHIFHPKCLEGWMNNSKTCPECRKPCQLESLLAIYINAACASDISESEEPTVLMGQIFALKKEITKMDEKLGNNSEEIDKLKAIVKNLEFMMKEKNNEIASLQNENESLRTCISNNNTQSKQTIQSVSASPDRNIPRSANSDLKSTSILYLKNGCDSDRNHRYIVLVEPFSTSNRISPQQVTAMNSQPWIDIISLEQPHDEVSLLVSEIVQKASRRCAPDPPSDFERCFGASAFDFDRSDLFSPDRNAAAAGRFDFSIFNIDPNEDPELAMALKSSIEEAEKHKSEDKDMELAIKLSMEQATLSTTNSNKEMVKSFLLNLLDRL